MKAKTIKGKSPEEIKKALTESLSDDYSPRWPSSLCLSNWTSKLCVNY
jgi:hypothetical protein